MKEKILAQLKLKYKGAPAKLLGQVADKLAAKVTKEDEIEGAIGELENQTIPLSETIAEIQKEGDARVAAAQKKWDKENPSKKQDDNTDDTDTDDGDKGKGKGKDKDDAPAWAKGLIESNKTLSEKLATLEKEKSQSAISGKVKANEKLKGIPEKFYKGRPLPDKEEEIEAWVTEVETDWNEFSQDSNNSAFAQSSQPFASAAAGGKVSPSVQGYIDAKTKPAEASGAIVGKKL